MCYTVSGHREQLSAEAFFPFGAVRFCPASGPMGQERLDFHNADKRVHFFCCVFSTSDVENMLIRLLKDRKSIIHFKETRNLPNSWSSRKT